MMERIQKDEVSAFFVTAQKAKMIDFTRIFTSALGIFNQTSFLKVGVNETGDF